jgi:adenylate cyclase
MVGYSRLMESNEEGTHEALMALREQVLDPGVARAGRQIVKNTGDGFLAVFESAQHATRCALNLQSEILDRAARSPPEQRIAFRMAVHLADVIVERDDVYGAGVNIAARLQAFAEPGAVVVSGAVAEQFQADLGVTTVDLGELDLRNMARPVRVFMLTKQTTVRLIGDAAAGADPRPSIAVLPFRRHLTDPDETYFADGIVDVVVHSLAALKELFVVSRGSALGYTGSMLDLRTVGRELGVRYVLYGGVLRSADRIRITAELTDTDTGLLVLSQKHEGAQSDLFALQDRIAASVARTIAPQIRDRELLRAMRKHPQNMSAYDFVLQAIDLLYRMDDASLARARGLLQQAIAHDPQYPPAYSYAAFWHIFRVGEMGADPIENANAAAKNALAAIERDGSDALALAIYGHVQSFLLRDYATGALFLSRALEAGPSSAMAWTFSSATQGYIGAGAEAVRHAEQGVRLAPLDVYTFWHEGVLAQAHYVNGDYDQALLWARQSRARNRSIRTVLRTLVATLVAMGRREEARTTASELLRLQPDFRLGAYASRCPFRPPVLDRWLGHLREAGLPK